MLNLNVAALLRERGVDTPARYLRDGGMVYLTVSRLLSGQLRQLSFDNIEKLCLICFCTPSDLFTWKKDDTKIVEQNHPLYKMVRKEPEPSPMDRINRLSKEKLAKLKELLDGLEKEDV